MACVDDNGMVLNGPSLMKYQKYKPFGRIEFDDVWKKRSWPDKVLKRAPRWCSVDLRDGNQALETPMNVQKKLTLFKHLVAMGFKEIEVGFPSSSQMEFDFCRTIIDEKLIPSDVWISVLVQARENLIRKTIEAVRGANNVIIHIYNSTSTLQRKVVFNKDCDSIKQMAVEGATLIKELVESQLLNGDEKKKTKVRLEYSPESFTGTELPFALDICQSVRTAWGRASEVEPIIFNLPSTVEMSTPNIYADQIEWFHTHLSDRKTCHVSVHTHNDRGCAVAATELALLAGADRVEGCLFGHGERTGNVCLVTLAVNLLQHGVDPEVNVGDLKQTVSVVEAVTGMPVSARHPWAGRLVYTAFSGSHQDAIRKGMKARAEIVKSSPSEDQVHWEVPYLPVDPTDVGFVPELVRINSQSGKGGVAFVMESHYGISLPPQLQIEFSRIVQLHTDSSAAEIGPADLYQLFTSVYLKSPQTDTELLNAIQLVSYTTSGSNTPEGTDCSCGVTAICNVFGEKNVTITSVGNGPVDSFVKGLNIYISKIKDKKINITVGYYSSVSIGLDSEASAMCFVEVVEKNSPITKFGVAQHSNTTTASLQAICSGVTHLMRCVRTGSDVSE
eukprot:GHVN01013725.1.p1 GENE.GHVN01013725.1~~GHVN01013725.1.p1  ORF type:complete len:616 (-),score=120.05 GHVN01013725.1:1620-3467(-)